MISSPLISWKSSYWQLYIYEPISYFRSRKPICKKILSTPFSLHIHTHCSCLIMKVFCLLCHKACQWDNKHRIYCICTLCHCVLLQPNQICHHFWHVLEIFQSKYFSPIFGKCNKHADFKVSSTDFKISFQLMLLSMGQKFCCWKRKRISQFVYIYISLDQTEVVYESFVLNPQKSRSFTID